MIYKEFPRKDTAAYSRPEVHLLDLESEENFCQSGELGGVGEGDPGQDEWFN